jgi:hypothetical protein
VDGKVTSAASATAYTTTIASLSMLVVAAALW